MCLRGHSDLRSEDRGFCSSLQYLHRSLIMEDCVLCGEVIEGYGNNAYPLSEEGECCDQCNYAVIYARLEEMLDDVK